MSGAKFTWMAKEAYPLFVTIGGGCLLCAFQLARSVAVNPDVSVMKSTRAQCIPEDWDAEKASSRPTVLGLYPEIAPGYI